MDTLTRLAELANTLDKQGLKTLADNVDGIISGIAKTAQYVGSQGYWIRNQRCWQNCYRQKRASSPEKQAQSIWFECLDEFQKSINKNSSSWDKYAESDGIVKTAETTKQDKKFAQEIKNSGNPSNAVEIINTAIDNMAMSYVDAAGAVLRLANVLEETDPLLANEAGTIARGLVKEAQWKQNLKGLWNNVTSPFKKTYYPEEFSHQSMQNMIGELGNALNGYKVLNDKIVSTLQQVADPASKAYAQQMLPMLKGVLNAAKIQQLSDLALKWDQSSQGKGQAPAAPGAAPGAATPPAAPGAPATAAPAQPGFKNPAFQQAIDQAGNQVQPGPPPVMNSPQPGRGVGNFNGMAPAGGVAPIMSPTPQMFNLQKKPRQPARRRTTQPQPQPLGTAASNKQKFLKLSQAQ